MISLVVGLGNIGAEYVGTRHNVGFQVIEQIQKQSGVIPQHPTQEYDWSIFRSRPDDVILAMPRTYMNRSGLAVEALLQRYQLDPSRMLVVVDDFNLPLGKLRIRNFGSDGGHNGLESIIETLQTEQFPRLRLGIGPVPEGTDVVEFVLGGFARDETEPARKMIETAAEAVVFSIRNGLDRAMTQFNNSNPAQSE